MEPQLLKEEQDNDSDSDSNEEEEEEEEVHVAMVAAVPEAISTTALTSLTASAFKRSYNNFQQSTLNDFLQALQMSMLQQEEAREQERIDQQAAQEQEQLDWQASLQSIETFMWAAFGMYVGNNNKNKKKRKKKKIINVEDQ